MQRFFSKTLLFLIALGFSISSWAGEAVWIDVRTAGEYGKEHVSQAVNIPYDVISDRIEEATANKDALIYVYCRSGRRSGIAQSTLQEAGYSNVVNLGGFDDAKEKAAEVKVD